ncbi:MAG TPA: tetratricopeptide repeat protein [Desulfomonilia bacterium]|nr:tetratricopeptide repeat protein [Desulfomonilia bacterium]
MMKRAIVCIMIGLLVSGCASQFKEQRKISRPLIALGMEKVNGDDIQGALIELRKAMTANPSDPEVYYGFAMAYWKSAKLDKALENVDKAIEYSNKLELEHPGLKGEAYNLKGTILFGQKKYDEAITCFKSAIADEVYQTPEYAMYNLATIYLEKKNISLAYDTVQKTLEHNSHYAPAWHLLSKIYVAQGKPSEAIDALRHAILEYPGYTEAHYDLAQLYLQLKAYEKAKEEFVKVIELDQGGPLGHMAVDKMKNLK